MAQPTSRIVQSPPGLENFAQKVQDQVDKHLNTQRQQELERQQIENQRLTEIAAENARVEAEQKERIEQIRIKIEQATTEAAKILEDFQIREKLEYIRVTVWGGKGDIKPIKPDFYDGNRQLGGFKLEFSYQTTRVDVDWKDVGYDRTERVETEQHSVDTTYLKVIVAHFDPRQKERDFRGKRFHIISPFLGNDKDFLGNYYSEEHQSPLVLDLSDLTDKGSREAELNELLMRESVARKLSGYIPSELYLEGQRRQKELAASRSSGRK